MLALYILYMQAMLHILYNSTWQMTKPAGVHSKHMIVNSPVITLTVLLPLKHSLVG